MALTDGLIGTTSPAVSVNGYEILDAIYSKTCVILEDVFDIFKGVQGFSGLSNVGIGVPLIGFEYKPEGNIELLKYTWSQYPYLNKAKLTFAAVKEVTGFSVSVISPITTGGSVVVNLALRLALVTFLEKYCNRGGKFTIVTLWGTKKHCVLTDLTGISQDDVMDGVLFKMTFTQPNFDMSSAEESMNDFMQKVTNGAIPG